MTREIPYCFFRYVIREHERPLTTFEDQWEIFRELEGLEIAYRKANPSESDKDTSLENLGYFRENFRGFEEYIIHFVVAKRIRERKVYLRVEEEGRRRVKETIRPSEDECAVCQAVAIPSKGLIAFQDRSGESYLPARSGINRLAAIVSQIQGMRLDFEDFSRIEDVVQFMRAFDIHTITFRAWPTNPGASFPGQILDSLMGPNNAELLGRAKARKETDGRRRITNPDEGFVGELVGLATQGYARVGIEGTTSKGYRIKTDKNPRGEESRYYPVRIYVPFDQIEETLEDHLHKVAQVLLEFAQESLL